MQNFLTKKVLYALLTAGLTSKIAQLQMFSKNSFEITPEQYIILAVLVENGELYQRQIGSICSKDRPNVTRLLNILEKKELVKRVQDTNKRKVFKIKITNEGYKVYSKIKPHLLELHNEAVDGISEDKLQVCLEVLMQIVQNLETKVKMQK